MTSHIIGKTKEGYLQWNGSQTIEAFLKNGTLLRKMWVIPKDSTLEDAEKIAGEILNGRGPVYTAPKTKGGISKS
jgi:hypothetical protein